MTQESPYSKPKNIYLRLEDHPLIARITDVDDEILEIESNGDGELIFRVPDVGHGSPVVPTDVLRDVINTINNREFELQ